MATQPSDTVPDDTEEIPSGRTGDRLLATAAALFRQKGYAASTTRELAAMLGIRKASLYHHIARKEDLLYDLCVDCLERIRHDVQAAVDRESDHRRRLETLINAHLTAALADQDKHATMLIELRHLSADRHRTVLRLRDDYEEMVRSVIVGAQDAGVVRADVSARYLTLALLNILNWSIFWFKPEGELSPKGLAEVLATVALDGMVTAPPRR